MNKLRIEFLLIMSIWLLAIPVPIFTIFDSPTLKEATTAFQKIGQVYGAIKNLKQAQLRNRSSRYVKKYDIYLTTQDGTTIEFTNQEFDAWKNDFEDYFDQDKIKKKLSSQAAQSVSKVNTIAEDIAERLPGALLRRGSFKFLSDNPTKLITPPYIKVDFNIKLD